MKVAFLRRMLSWKHVAIIPVGTLFLALSLTIALRNDVPDYDECVYCDIAKNISRTGLPQRSWGGLSLYTIHPPLYEYLGALLYVLHIGSLLTMRLLSTAASLSTVLLTYWLGTAVRNSRVGFLAACITAVNGYFAAYSHSVYSEPTATALYALSMCLFLRAEQRESPWLWGASGIAVGLGFLAKYLGLFLVAAYVSYMLTRPLQLKERFRRLACVLLPAAIPVVLWFLVLSAVNWRAGVMQFRTLMNLAQHGSVVDMRSGLTVGRFAVLTVQWIGMCWALSGVVVTASALRFFRTGATTRDAFLVVPTVFVLLLTVAMFRSGIKELRHFIVAVPFVSLTIAAGAADLCTWLTTRFPRRNLVKHMFSVTAAVLVVAASVNLLSWNKVPVLGTWVKSRYVMRLYPPPDPYREIGRFVREITPPGEVVTAVRGGPMVCFHSDRPYDMLYLRRFHGVRNVLGRSRVVVRDGRFGRELDLLHLSPEEKREIDRILSRDFGVVHKVGDIEVLVRQEGR